MPELLEVEALFANPVFSGAQLSPDGSRIAYLAPHDGRTNIWVRGIDEEPQDAVCVTHDRRRGIRTFRWTSDSRWLLYLQDTDGNEDWHLYRVDPLDPGAGSVDLTPVEPGSRVFAFEDAREHPGSVVVTMNARPLYTEAFLVNVATGTTSLLQGTDDRGTTFVVGAGGELVTVRLADDRKWELLVADASGAPRVVHRAGGPDQPLGIVPTVVGPRAEHLYVGSYEFSDDLQLVRVDVATGERTVAAAVPGHSVCTMGTVSPTQPPTVLLSRRTGDVIAVRFTGDRPVLLPVDPHFAEVLERLETLSDGAVGWVSSDTTEQLWVVTFVHDREHGRTYLYDHRTGESRYLFRAFPDLDPEQLAPTTAVRLAARDGLPLHGFLTLPLDVEPRGLPLVLVVHGGPWCHDMWLYNPPVQFFANRGYAVLQVNFRGSSGYGRMHMVAAIGEFAGAMHDDLIDAVEWAVQEGIADPARLAVYGGSYGGYSALVGVTVTPDHFAAAVDYVGISSLPNFMRTLPDFVKPQMVNSWYAYVGDPEDPDQEAAMLQRSPITMVDKIRTPLLVAQGANDARVVQAESDNLVEALRARGVPVEYVVAQDEGHGFQNPENNHDLYRRIERFFGARLGGRVRTDRSARP